MKPSDDNDWLCPEREAVDAHADTERPPFTGVYRVEAHGEQGVPYPSMHDATHEPPHSPEAEVRGPGGCLAQSSPDHACWFVTDLGRRRLADERGIMIAKDADTQLAVLLREDFLQVG